MRILVTGSRSWKWSEIGVIAAALDDVVGNTPAREVVVVHGACRTGADAMADELARLRGWDVERHLADWARYGRYVAGAVRNKRMAQLGADVVLAFIRDGSTGSSGCLFEARRKNIPAVVWRHDGDRIWLDDQKASDAGVHPDQGELF